MSGPHPDPLDPLQNLEPAARAQLAEDPSQHTPYLTLDGAIAMSQAISLKRIADRLDDIAGANGGAGMEQWLWTLGQCFGRGMGAV